MLGLFLILAGFIIGLGAVTVIDLHGFLGRKSQYWTEATTRTHKVTKPLIWLGIVLHIVGVFLFVEAVHWQRVMLTLDLGLILNGLFLSFAVSPFLLLREKKKQQKKLLPAAWQRMITVSFLVSFAGWWGNVLLFVIYLSAYYHSV